MLQAFSGDDCAMRFGADAPSVCAPIGIDVAGPTDRVDLAVTEVAVSVRDVNSDASYRVSGVELIALVRGAVPSSSVPDGFAFSSGFGFLLTDETGTVLGQSWPAASGVDAYRNGYPTP